LVRSANNTENNLNAGTGKGWPVRSVDTGRAGAPGSPAVAGALDDTAGFMAVLPEPQRSGARDTGSKTAALHTPDNCDNLLDIQETM